MTRLKYERLQRGWSQAMLATIVKRSGFDKILSQPEICLFEINRLIPRPEELEALARALGVEPPSALLQEIQTEQPQA